MRVHDRPQVALVIGASSGIGRAVALRLSTVGVPVVLSARSRPALEAVAAECRALGGSPRVEPLDVRDERRVDEVVAATVARHGHRAAVIHTAAVIAYGHLEHVPRDVATSVLATNLGGAVTVSRCAMRAFRRVGGGHLVLVGSLLGEVVTPYLGPYTISKWGIHALARTLQVEARHRADTHVSLIAPAGTDTPIYLNGATVMGRRGRALPPVRTADDVATDVMRTLARPRRTRTAGLVHHASTTAYRLFPAAYDAIVTPLSRTLALAPWRGLAPTMGNVHAAHHLSHPPEEGRFMNDHPAERHTLGRPRVSRAVAAPAEAVWSVLADGWFYATWVVGASRVRRVDHGWPDPGTRLHHSVGLWPAVLSDSTVVEEAEPPHRLLLRARGWPVGEALVELTIVPDGDEDCTVTIAEDAVSGPGRIVPMPLRQLGILPRNQEALRRLALIAEGRHREAVSPEGRGPTQS